jgi:hypothetical protein
MFGLWPGVSVTHDFDYVDVVLAPWARSMQGNVDKCILLSLSSENEKC